jgi:hypothetical protein
MKYTALIPAILVLFPFISRAQDDIDFGSFDEPVVEQSTSSPDQLLALSGRVGYGIKVGGAPYPGSIEGETRKYGSDGEIIERKDHYLNYGQGLKFELAGALALMENLDAELTLQFTGKVPRTVIEHDTAGNSWEEKFRHASLGAKVMILPRFRVLELIDMHVGFGVGLYFTTLKYTNTDALLGQYEGYVKTRPGLVFAGKVGGEYPLTDRMSITADICAEAVSYTVKERRTTYSTTTGPMIYKSEYDRSSSSIFVERPAKIPGSNVAILLGMRFAIL